MNQGPRHDHNGERIRVGDTVRFVRNPEATRVVASFDTLALTGVRFEDGSWTQARHLEVIR